jgi:hypothetical protein
MYRPASFTYAFGSPEKGLLVYVWIQAPNLSKKTPLSSTATYMRRRNARCVFKIFDANGRPHYLVMAALSAARLAWDIAWAFSFKTLPIRRPIGFKNGDYGGATAGAQLFPQCLKSVF